MHQLAIALKRKGYIVTGSDDEIFEPAKSNLAAAAVYARDSQESLANIYGSSLAEGETLDAIVQWPERIEEVTREEAIEIARASLDINDSVTGWLLPPEAAE